MSSLSRRNFLKASLGGAVAASAFGRDPRTWLGGTAGRFSRGFMRRAIPMRR